MESIKRNTYLILLSILVFLIPSSIVWYSGLDVVEKVKTNEKIELSYDEAVKRFGENEAISERLVDTREIVYTQRRTMILFKYHNDTITKSKWETIRIKK